MRQCREQATLVAQAQELEALSAKLMDLENQARIDAPKLEEREQMSVRIKRLTQFLLAWCARYRILGFFTDIACRDNDLSRARGQRKRMEDIVSEWRKAVELRDADAQQIDDLSRALRYASDLHL
jgi:hypothetical protein